MKDIKNEDIKNEDINYINLYFIFINFFLRYIIDISQSIFLFFI